MRNEADAEQLEQESDAPSEAPSSPISELPPSPTPPPNNWLPDIAQLRLSEASETEPEEDPTPEADTSDAPTPGGGASDNSNLEEEEEGSQTEEDTVEWFGGRCLLGRDD